MKKYNLINTIILNKGLVNNSFKNSLEEKLMNELDNRTSNNLRINIMKKILGVTLLVSILVLGGYLGSRLINNKDNDSKTETETDNRNQNNNTGIANPASTKCIDDGGTIEIRNEKSGQVGYCKFKDGRTCEEWSYFRGECKKGDNK